MRNNFLPMNASNFIFSIDSIWCEALTVPLLVHNCQVHFPDPVHENIYSICRQILSAHVLVYQQALQYASRSNMDAQGVILSFGANM